jgi:hypothetical protein
MNTLAAQLTATKTKKGPRLHWPLLWTLVVTMVVVWGSRAHLEHYITPQRGVGYWLGIVGGSMMILLLLYSARKRYRWLRVFGGIPAWFEFHMVLGVVGPLLIVFHANFKLGATNSNVALISMLLVAGSGVVGRYIYTRLHARMDGTEDTLEQMKAVGERLRSRSRFSEFMPGLVDVIERVELRLITPPKGRVARLLHLSTGAVRMAMARHIVRREIKLALAKKLHVSPRIDSLLGRHSDGISMAARNYAYRRLEAGRRIQEYRLYARLFSFWHVLHIPLFFMLLIAGIVHVIAVNIY